MVYLSIVSILLLLIIGWALLCRPTVIDSPEEALQRLRRLRPIPSAPALFCAAFAQSMVDVPTLTMQQLVDMHRERKLMFALLRNLPPAEVEGFIGVFAQQSLQLSWYIAGVVCERSLRMLTAKVPALFTCAALDARANLVALVREACAETRPDILMQISEAFR